MTSAKIIGRSLPRREDPPLITGRGRFAADIHFPGQWTMRVVRAAVAHGEIRSIDAAAALALPGVHAVWTHADVAHIPPIPFRLTGLKTLEPYRQTILADRIVRYVGEPVALVFADDAYVAEDAAELVVLGIAPRDVAMSASDAHAPEADVIRKGYGDVDAAFANAHAVVALDLAVGRHTGVPMETRGAIATYDTARDLL